MSKLAIRPLLCATLALAVGCTGDITGDVPPEDSAPEVDGLTIDRLDPATGIEATFVQGDVVLVLRADVQGDRVASTIARDGVVLTRLVVPAGTDRDVGSALGALVRTASEDRAPGVDYPAVAAVYVRALQALFEATDDLDRSTTRFALMWHEEVIMRMVPNPDADTASMDIAWDDAIYTLDDDPDMPLHTNFMAAPHLGAYRAAGALRCNLNCSWYDVCCWHDQWCVNCDRWYCGPTCVPGCFGGDCGGGR